MLTSGITLKDEVLVAVELIVQVVATAATLEELLEELDLLVLEEVLVLLVVLVEVDLELDEVELLALLVDAALDVLGVLDALVDVDPVMLDEDVELEPDERTKYAPTPAAATMTTIATARIAGAIPRF